MAYFSSRNDPSCRGSRRFQEIRTLGRFSTRSVSASFSSVFQWRGSCSSFPTSSTPSSMSRECLLKAKSPSVYRGLALLYSLPVIVQHLMPRDWLARPRAVLEPYLYGLMATLMLVEAGPSTSFIYFQF